MKESRPKVTAIVRKLRENEREGGGEREGGERERERVQKVGNLFNAQSHS